MAIRRAAERGHASHGWLDTHHTFSFAGYYDPEFMGFSHLRVINEDRVAPGRGFGTHPHRNMEIISYVVGGSLEHRDTLGTGSVIRPGEIQVMSAGTGVAHSEFNGSREEPVHFLQIWILPRQGGTEPRYAQQAFDTEARGAQLLVSPDARDASLMIGQDTDLWRVRLDADGEATLDLSRPRAWVQVVHGEVEVEGVLLLAGDGLAIAGRARPLTVVGRTEDAEALVFDLR